MPGLVSINKILPEGRSSTNDFFCISKEAERVLMRTSIRENIKNLAYPYQKVVVLRDIERS